jgi:hypothetical protein
MWVDSSVATSNNGFQLKGKAALGARMPMQLRPKVGEPLAVRMESIGQPQPN